MLLNFRKPYVAIMSLISHCDMLLRICVVYCVALIAYL